MNLAKSRVMRSVRNDIVGEMSIMMDGQLLEEVEVFKYLGSLVTAVGKVEAEVQQRVLEGSKVLKVVQSILKSMTMSWRLRKHCTSRSWSPQSSMALKLAV